MKTPRITRLIAGLALATASNAHALAQPPSSVASRILQSQSRPLDNARDDEGRAREWNLRAEEWSRYQSLMQGPLGTYSPNLDPLTALGIEARSDEERRRYAELQVQAEAFRVAKTLTYQRAYDAAWQRLHPGQPRVGLGERQSASATTGKASPPGNAAPGRIAIFVKDGCAACDQRVSQLQSAGTGFDIYVVGSRGDDDRIRRWASRAGIDPERVRARTITLNHDGGRWLALGLPGDLPAVVREVDGQWQRQ
ncbi:TIGR03759 family integrating conjugative element protein [Xanthomonas oryzae pv. oryzicola]|uniref:TIGR03759 family integrating conjugative element protein n=1 Tax=Xanthomonas oryzae TaxID=347 RepID=UPI0010330916|nr:TIGR03759 family integrating conjugative element protein [Xanthomonas oryzae]QBG94586.1 TIGR03759 family integrating conjugative element protein [Xanthomonas oryzae]QBH01368.1 TIGR03759 family integrating conjugative element protein [Xanthomonas oryzae]